MIEAAFERLYQRAGGSDVFGTSPTLVCDTYRRCLVGDAQPLVWLEVPLLGEPGFDMDVSYRRDQLRPGDRFIMGDRYGYQPLVDWVASTKQLPFGIGIAVDLMDDKRGHGVYINTNNIDTEMRDEFFRAIGQEEAGSGSHTWPRASRRGGSRQRTASLSGALVALHALPGLLTSD